MKLLIYILLTFFLLALALTPSIFNNPVWSVLSFIVVFLIVAVLLIKVNIEFLAFVYAIVYIGAVAVLFLFVVMLLKVQEHYHTIFNKLSIVLLAVFIGVIVHKLQAIFLTTPQITRILYLVYLIPLESIIELTDTTLYQFDNVTIIKSELFLLANGLYSLFSMLFIETGFILLIALIAVIVLTKNKQFFKN